MARQARRREPVAGELLIRPYFLRISTQSNNVTLGRKRLNRVFGRHSRPAGAFDTVYRFAWRARPRKYKRTLRSLLLFPLLENVASQPTQRQRLRIGLCGPVQIELVRTPTALFRPFNLARAAAVFQLRTTHRSPYTYVTRRPSAAKIGTVNQPFVIFLEAASQTATALLK